MNKHDIYNLIKNKNIYHEIIEHTAVYNMEEAAMLNLPYQEEDAKNILIRDDKKNHYYLITLKSYKRLDLKKFRKDFNTRPLTFASSEELYQLLNLIPGAVTPLGLLNDYDLKVQFYLDQEFLEGRKIIGIHPNDNTATIFIKTKDLIDILEEYHHITHIIEL